MLVFLRSFLLNCVAATAFISPVVTVLFGPATAIAEVNEDARSLRVAVPRANPKISYDVEYATTSDFAEGTVVLKKTGKSPFYLVLDPGIYHMRWREEMKGGTPSKWISQGVFYRKHPAPRFNGLKTTYESGPVEIRWEKVGPIDWYLVDVEGPGIKQSQYMRAQELILDNPQPGKFTVKVAAAVSDQFPEGSEVAKDAVKAFTGTPTADSTFYVGKDSHPHRQKIELTYPQGRIPYVKAPLSFSWEPIAKAKGYKITLYREKDGQSLVVSESPNVTQAFSNQIAGVLGAGQYRWTVETQSDDSIFFGELNFAIEDQTSVSNGSQLSVNLRAGRFDYSTSMGGQDTAFGSNINGFDINAVYASSRERAYLLGFTSDSIVLRGFLANFERVHFAQKRITAISPTRSLAMNIGYTMSSSFDFLARTNIDFMTGNSRRHSFSLGGEYSSQLNAKTSFTAEVEMLATLITQGGALSGTKTGLGLGTFSASVKATHSIDFPLAVTAGLQYLNDSYGYTSGNKDVTVKHTQLLGSIGIIYQF